MIKKIASGPKLGRRALLKGAGALAMAPFLMGLGGEKPQQSLPGVKKNQSAKNYNTKLVLLGTTRGMTWWPGSFPGTAERE